MTVQRLTDEDIRYLLGAISDSLLNGGHMTNANVAMEALCAHLGVERDSLPVDRKRARAAFDKQFAMDGAQSGWTLWAPLREDWPNEALRRAGR